MADSFRVVALISTFNEGDIVSAVIGHLVETGIEVYLLDNHSTDDTVEQARQWLGRGLIAIESFPQETGSDPEATRVYDWTAILGRKEDLARELDADWYMHHDADEIRESPWPGTNLKDAIRWVDSLGYNCIDYRVFNFRPVDDGFEPGDDPRSYFTLYEESGEFDRVQLKTWKATGAPVSLRASGGHQASFEGRRVFPIPFLLLHYPIRGQTHGLRKVFAERKSRFLEREHAQGWHVQYDRFEDETHTFVRDPSELRPFDLEQARLECMLPGNALRDLAERLARTDAELQWRLAQKEDLERNLAEHRVHAAKLEEEREELRQHAAALERALEECRLHIADVEQDREGVRQHAANLERELAALRERAEQLDAPRLQAERQCKELAEELGELRSSRSWRWTAPLRKVLDALPRK